MGQHDDHDDIDELFTRGPILNTPHQFCPYCKNLITDEEYAFWIVGNPKDDHYTAFCNQLHWEAFIKTGVFAKQEPPALSLD